MVYDLSDQTSYNNLENWKLTFLNTSDTPNLPFILVGNKLDEKRTISKEIAIREWIDTGKARLYMETSAKTGTNVEETFKLVAEHAHAFQVNDKDTREAMNHNVINIKNLRPKRNRNEDGVRKKREQASGCAC